MAGINVATATLDGLGLDRRDTLLILCARLEMTPPQHAAARELIAAGIDWTVILEKAAWHRLTALVAHHLMSLEPDTPVPAAVQRQLRRIHYGSLARNMQLQDELARLLGVLQKEAIPAVVLKGSALLGSVYSDISLRPMSDLDILVRPEHVDRAGAVALEQGYAFLVDSERQQHERQHCRHLANLRHTEKQIYLEVHQHIVSPDEPYRFDLEELWSRTRPFQVCGVPALTFGPEDLLVHLGIKFLLDRRYSSQSALGQLCDVSEVARRYAGTLDWQLIETSCRRNGALAGLYFVLYACRRLLQTPLPDFLPDRFQPREFDAALADAFIRRRVLDTRPWLAHGLADTRQNGRQGLAGAVLHRIRKAVAGAGRAPKNAPAPLGGFKLVLRKLGRAVTRPVELKRDLELDGWLHRLSKDS